MNLKLIKLNEELKKLIEGKTKIVKKLNDTVGSSLTLMSTWKEIEDAISELNVGGGFVAIPSAFGLKIIFLTNYKVVENEFGETLQLL